MRLLGKGDDETFNSIEFYFFRDNLIPASGFQTAQFRLIQKALGKTNLLAVRLFPSDTFSRNYKGKINGPVRVTDQIILRRGAEVATPPEGSRLAMIAVLDELAHALLAKLPPYEPKPSPMASIRDYEVKRASNILDNLLEHKRHEDRRREIKFSESARAKSDANILELFNRDLTEAMNRENQRREGFSRARLGALYLRKKAKGSHLATVFDRLVAADNNLFGTHDTSFLTVHSRVAISRIDDATDYARRIGKPEPPSGTGGGGKHYLGYSRSSLIPLFKALIAYRGL